MTLEDLLALETLDGFETERALDLIGVLVDHATDTADPRLATRALGFAGPLEARGLNPLQSAELDYFRANGWAVHQIVGARDQETAWSWVQPEIEHQIFYLRRARTSLAFASLERQRQCEILTNLGNLMSSLGRFVEAQAYWAEALVIDGHFWMARANSGHGLMFYAENLYDDFHRAIFAFQAHGALLAALVAMDSHPHLGDVGLMPLFADHAAAIGQAYDLDRIEENLAALDCDFSGEPDEIAYRRWCIGELLFLNPLNDATREPVAAADVLILPSFTTGIDDPPITIGIFNQLKQEYVSARWIYYQGMTRESTHFSDKEVLLYDTLDYPAYGLAIEQMKAAYRVSYSILDKIAYFLNRYLALGVPPKRVYFRTIWREKDNGPVRPIFESSRNWAWRGLYWLSRDLFDETLRETTEPDAQALAELRNHLEHKYVKVVELEGPATVSPHFNPFHDEEAYRLTRRDLERKSLRLLKLVRAALLYLALGMHHEERRKERSGDGLAGEMTLHMMDDGRKKSL